MFEGHLLVRVMEKGSCDWVTELSLVVRVHVIVVGVGTVKKATCSIPALT